MKNIKGILAGLALALIVLFYFVSPYHNFILVPLCVAFGIFYLVKSREIHDIVLYPLIIVATVCLFFVGGELFLNATYEPPAEETGYTDMETAGLSPYSTSWYPDSLLGYGPKMDENKVRCTKVLLSDNNRVIYDVVYSMDAKGRRITIDNESSAEYAVLLFGCSFTFGDGLNDTETFAWKLGHLLGEKYQVINYAFQGWGSHQMLALLQSDRLDYLKKKYKKVYAYYLTFPGIELRSAGYSKWDRKGPKYLLNEQGKAVFTGSFQDNSTWMHNLPDLKKIKQSFLLGRVYAALDKNYITYDVKEKQLQLHAATIEAARKEVLKKFANATFTTVLYETFDDLKVLLQADNMRILELNDAFLPLGVHSDVYAIPHDKHPTAAATTIVAEEYLKDINKQR